jgi:PAS domain S-box-containing protein
MNHVEVLHVDDDDMVLEFVKEFVTQAEPEILITSVESPREALELLHSRKFDCIVSDYRMPDIDGLAFAAEVRRFSDTPIILYTGQGSEEVAEWAFAIGVDDYIRKENHPAHYQVLAKRIVHVVERKKAEKALIESEERYRTLVDNSPYAISVTVGDKIVYANPSRAKLVGEDDPSKLIGTSSQTQIAKRDKLRITERRRMRESGVKPSSPFAFQLVNKDGNVRDVLDYSLEIRYGGEKAVQHMLLDVTEHKLYEKRLEALHRNELELSEAVTLDEVAELTLNAIESTLGFDRCGFGVVVGDMLQFHHIRGVEGVIDLPLSGGGITVRAVRTGETQAVPNIRVDDDYVEGVKSDYRALSEVAVPVRVVGDVVAVLNVESSRLEAYTGEDVKLLEILSETVASAIQRNRLLESMRSHAINLEALQRHAANLLNMSTIDEVARCTFDIIENVLNVSDGAIGFVEGDALIFKYAKNVSADQLPVLPLDGAGISVRAVRTGETQLVHDTQSDSDFVFGYGRTLSELDVPVKIDGRVVAVINLEDPKPNAFSEEEKTVVEILSEHVATVISRIEQLGVIRASEEKYRKVLDSSLDSVLLMSGTKIIYTNEIGAKLVGYDSVSELIGQDFMDLLPEEEKDLIRQRTLSRQRGESQPNTYELRLLRKDGTIVEVEAAVSLTEIEGKPAILAFARDISDRKLYQTKLVQLHGSAKRLAGTSTRDEVWDVAIETVTQILGFDFGGIGVLEDNTIKYVRNVGDDLPKDWRVDLSKPSITSRTIETGIPQLVRDTSLDPDYLFAPGTVRRGSELASPIMVDGKPVALLNIESMRTSAFTEADVSLIQILVGQVTSALDRITHFEEESRRRETRQRELVDGMERMSSMVRHDLRGPLQTIQSASYMIRRRPDRAEELTRKIDESVDYAVRILDDLKTMTKHEALNRVSTNLSDLVEKSLDGASIPASVRVKRNLPPLSLEVDQYRIRRVVDNLVKNAVEAMPDGGTLSVKVEEIEGMALLTVKDSGRGIADDAARNLFIPFFTTKSTGTGLGLSICKQVVEAHSGRIAFESRVGEGTTFTVALPLKQASAYGNEAVSTSPMKSAGSQRSSSDSGKRARGNQ